MRRWIVSALMMMGWGLGAPVLAQDTSRPQPLTLAEAEKLTDAQLLGLTFRQLAEQPDIVSSARTIAWGLHNPTPGQGASAPKLITLVEAGNLTEEQFVERTFHQLSEQVDAVRRPSARRLLPPNGLVGHRPSFDYLGLRLKPRAIRPIGVCRIDFPSIRFKMEPDRSRWIGLARTPWEAPWMRMPSYTPDPDPLTAEPGMSASSISVAGAEEYAYAPGIPINAGSEDFAAAEAACRKVPADAPLLSVSDPNHLIYARIALDYLGKTPRKAPPPFELDCMEPNCPALLASLSKNRILDIDKCDFYVTETCLKLHVMESEAGEKPFVTITAIGAISRSGDKWAWKLKRVAVDRISSSLPSEIVY